MIIMKRYKLLQILTSSRDKKRRSKIIIYVNQRYNFAVSPPFIYYYNVGEIKSFYWVIFLSYRKEFLLIYKFIFKIVLFEIFLHINNNSGYQRPRASPCTQLNVLSFPHVVLSFRSPSYPLNYVICNICFGVFLVLK